MRFVEPSCIKSRGQRDADEADFTVGEKVDAVKKSLAGALKTGMGRNKLSVRRQGKTEVRCKNSGTLLAAWLIGAFLAGLLWPVPSLRAQAKIDPSLPPRPLVHKRSLLIFPGYDTVGNPDISIPPLTPKQKWDTFVGRSFDFSMPIDAAMFAGLSQAINYSPHYGTEEIAYVKRLGAYSGSLTSSAFFGDFLFPVAFHQDPRYLRKGHGSIPSRVWYAVSREGVTHRDDGKETFNSSGLLGFTLSTMISNAYYPRSSITLDNNLQRLGVKIAISGILNIIREFGAKPAVQAIP